VGLAALVAVFGTASRSALAHPVAGLSAADARHHILAHGMSAAFGVAALFDLATLVLIVLLLRPSAPAATAGRSPVAGRVRSLVRVPDTAEEPDVG
jgi:hypothetical protein